MSTSAPISADEFQALEHKVLRAVEIVRRERDARVAAETELAELRGKVEKQAAELDEQSSAHAAQRDLHAAELEQHRAACRAQLSALQQERLDIRQRVEKMLGQMDELL